MSFDPVEWLLPIAAVCIAVRIAHGLLRLRLVRRPRPKVYRVVNHGTTPVALYRRR